MSKKKSKKIAVVYHSSCPDGFAAAWAAWKKFGSRAEYHPVAHSDKPLALRGKEAYFLDLAYKPHAMRRVIKEAAKVVVIDHHVSSESSVKLAKEHVYDLKHSGAFLAWKYFHPGKPVPRLIRHIEDEDLWKFKLADTKAVNARLELLNFSFNEFDKAVRDFEKLALRRKFVQEGKLLGAYRTRLVHRLIEENAALVNFLGYRILAINGAKPFTSEIGNVMCKMHPPLAIVWQERKNNVIVSLRSNGKVDVSKIAVRFGGGGHKAAAAFNLPLGAKKPWTHIK
jgi:oligoribonuclease NrnB/cAMP/cGMP phosphodiesterase (DHH superfamily)